MLFEKDIVMPEEKNWGTTENGRFEFISYSGKFRDGVINVIRKSFFQFEAVSVGCEINECIDAQYDLELLCLDVLKNSNSSIIAIDTETNQVVGVALNVIQLKSSSTDGKTYFETFRDEVCKTENAKNLMSYMNSMDQKFDCFKYYDVDSILEIMFLATLPKFMRRGIGYNLCLCSVKLAKELSDGKSLELLPPEMRHRAPQLVTALMTSHRSQKIADKLNATIHHIEPHKNFIFNGKSYADRNGDPDCVSQLIAIEL